MVPVEGSYPSELPEVDVTVAVSVPKPFWEVIVTDCPTENANPVPISKVRSSDGDKVSKAIFAAPSMSSVHLR